MRTRARFVLLFAAIGVAIMVAGATTLYYTVGRDAAARAPSEAEALLGRAAAAAVDESAEAGRRLSEAADALIAARSMLARSRLLAKDDVVRLSLRMAAVLGSILLAGAAIFAALSRLAGRGLDELARSVLRARLDRSARVPRLEDPDLDGVGRELNALLDLSAEQERRLAEAARLEGWREVATFLAHQLKNPLAAIRLAAQNAGLALREGALGEGALGAGGSGAGASTASECAAIVVAEADRLSALVSRFRDLAPEGLGAYLGRGSADLAEAVRACALRAEARGASVTVEAPDGGAVAVACDRSLLEQALWNLFANSVEACPGRAASIRAIVARSGGSASVTVTDSGGPVDPALVARLGREQVTTKPGGAGLGLMLARRILAASGGSLDFFATGSGGLGARATMPTGGQA
jgi:signal transduction histidine kinase